MKDIENTMKQEQAKYGLGLTFIIPHYKNGKNIEEKLDKLENDIFQSNYGLIAW